MFLLNAIRRRSKVLWINLLLLLFAFYGSILVDNRYNRDFFSAITSAALEENFNLFQTESTLLHPSPGWYSADSDRTSSIAWADVDNDGDLDLAAGNWLVSSKLYLNEGGVLSTRSSWASTQVAGTHSIAWGDVDNDGDLDLAVGNAGVNRVYLNNNGVLENTSSWESFDEDNTYDLAWGDVNGDGYLDLAAANALTPNKIYMNDQGVLLRQGQAFSTQNDDARAIAWGDWDDDHDPDLAVGSTTQTIIFTNAQGVLQEVLRLGKGALDLAWGDVDGDTLLDLAVVDNQSIRVFINTGGNFTESNAWVYDQINANSVDWADVDGDGDLDLAVGSVNLPLKLFLNQGGSLDSVLTWSSDDENLVSEIAWGDVDRDGDLDLAVGNWGGTGGVPNKLYVNQSAPLLAEPQWILNNKEQTFSLAWGDVDLDGDLDLASGNRSTSDKVYENVDGVLQTAPLWNATDSTGTNSIAWGDIDGDGDLDLAVGSVSGGGPAVKVYFNHDGTLEQNASWSAGGSSVYSVAWGDMDGDKDLDLAVGTLTGANLVYINTHGNFVNEFGLDLKIRLEKPNSNARTMSVAWGDMDGDGDLELATGNLYAPNQIYINDNGTLRSEHSLLSLDEDATVSVAWADFDSDGDTDLTVGNQGAANKIYINEGGTLDFIHPVNLEVGSYAPVLAWGDADSDGDLDLITSRVLYLNHAGMLEAALDWSKKFLTDAHGVAWGDVDSDGRLDLAISNIASGAKAVVKSRIVNTALTHDSRLAITIHVSDTWRITEENIIQYDRTANYYSSPYIRETGIISFSYALSHPLSEPVREIRAYYSTDGGDHWKKAVPTASTITQNLRTSPFPTQTVTNTHVYGWNVLQSGFFGQSDNVVFRLEALPTQNSPADGIPGPFWYASLSTQTFPFRVRGTQVRVFYDQMDEAHIARKSIVYQLPFDQNDKAQPIADYAGKPFQTNQIGFLDGRGTINIGDRLFALTQITATDSFTLYYTSPIFINSRFNPFVVTQPSIQNLIVSAKNPLYLFNLDIALEWDARNDIQYMADLRANLQETSRLLFDWSNGQAALGDINIYHNKEKWNEADIRIHANNNLRPKATIGGVTTGLRFERIATSSTSTQTLIFAKGYITMGATWTKYGTAGEDNKDDWARTLAHELGHYLFFLLDNYIGLDGNDLIINVRGCPGVMSNPYIEADSEFHPKQDWLERCSRTLSQHIWQREDWGTLTTFYQSFFAPPDTMPINHLLQSGPSSVPLAVTQIHEKGTGVPVALSDPTYFLLYENGETYFASSQAQAVLLQDGRLINLGRPRRDRIAVHGGRPNDVICVYDFGQIPEPATSCATIRSLEPQLYLKPRPAWQPDAILSPTSPYTIQIQVGNIPSGLSLYAQLYPTNISLTTPYESVELIYNESSQTYTGQLSSLEVALEAQVHIHSAKDGVHSPDDMAQGIVVDYVLGGAPTLVLGAGASLTLSDTHQLVNPDGTTLSLSGGSTLSLSGGSILFLSRDGLTLSLSGGSTLSLSGGSTLSLSGGSTLSLSGGSTLTFPDGDTLSISSGSTLSLSGGSTLSLSGGSTLSLSGGSAPIRSSDGQVILYTDALQFDWDEYYTLQPALTLPSIPLWTTVVGTPYRLIASPSLLNSGKEITASIGYQYLGRDIDEGKEKQLQIYYYGGEGWQALSTEVDEEHNIAVARSKGPGMYALMYSITQTLYSNQWNPLHYPLQETRLLTPTLSSINGKYTTIYGYNPSQPALAQWEVYDVHVPAYVNSLIHLRPGPDFSIWATETITLFLKDDKQIRAAGVDALWPVPPATYYGLITSTISVEISPGSPIQAFIDDMRCGVGKTSIVDNHLVYVVHVYADDGNATLGCGAPGKVVHFKVGDQWADTTGIWGNTELWALPMSLTPKPLIEQPSSIKIHLPLIYR